MSDLRKAAAKALVAWDSDWSEPRNETLRERMEALRQTLAMEVFSKVNQEIEEALKQPQQEPVAYTGNGTAGREADVKPTGFFFQADKRHMKFPFLDAKAKLVRIMGTFDLATGHGDTMDELLDSLESELRDVLGHYREALKKQRTWVGLEDEDVATVKNEFNRGALWAEQVLKEKNT